MSEPKVVHEGRGGYVEIDGARFPIEHVGEGRFVIHVSAARRYAGARAALERFVTEHPEMWALASRGR